MPWRKSRPSSTPRASRSCAMTPDPSPASPAPGPPGAAARFPAWSPAWAVQLGELCFSGTTSVFLLHGNTNDLVRRGESPDEGYGTIAEFLAEQMFGKWDLVLLYDLGRGLRAFAGRNEKRLQRMTALANEKICDLSEVKNDPGLILALLDRFVRANIIAAAQRPISAAVLIDQASFLFPTGEPGPTLARLTAGISLTDLAVLVKLSMETGRRLDAKLFRDLKKRLIEKQAQGLLEFIEPKWALDTVIGHEAAKRRLRDDATLLRQGRLDSLPMGYLLCGPVGTGKSFLAQCAAGELGIPCVILKNFRSKYVGETEGNLERVLSVLDRKST